MANAHNQPQCRNDALLLNVCANILNVVDVGIGSHLSHVVTSLMVWWVSNWMLAFALSLKAMC
ncbi:hypothetical protein Gogos_000176 [Gossypium gossypioides]|uniref:Uncharacterized protein n=1 Tax=Gossypium gossypioides TaxID=34282 RepID=A0A7J9CRW7_GOSGO|nr:hypothetical protein [Gossypium gossypioides]